MCQNRTWTVIGSMCIPKHQLSFQVLTWYSAFNVHFITVASQFFQVLPCFVTGLVSMCSVHMLAQCVTGLQSCMHSGKSSTILESIHGSRVYKEYYA